MYCIYCGKPAEAGEICNECRDKKGIGKIVNSPYNGKITEKAWFIFLMYIVFFPLGIFFMWKNKHCPKLVKIVVTIIFVLLIIAGLFYKDDNVNINKEELNNKIVLKYGEYGDYGKDVIYDGEAYIEYFVPYGKYNVTSETKNVTVYVASDIIIKNSDGYDENNILTETFFKNINETKIINIPQGNHIELTINAIVNLEKID